MNPIKPLTAIGQSLWYDNIQRRLLENGELAGMIARGEIRGVTSNPTIFHNAIARTGDYAAALLPLAWSGWEAERIFWQLAVEDIQAAADLFRPLYEDTGGGDGYVSLEVSPALAHDTEATLAQAEALWARVARPNLMIKIPATPAGLPAIHQAIAAGINVNVTLIFSLQRYAEVMDACLSGLEARLEKGLPLDRIASVASFFVSRLDSKVDAHLEALVKAEGERSAEAAALLGQAAIANVKLAYAAFQETFAGPRFAHLQKAGARPQRPLWASTSTKNPAYPDTLYVDNLIGPQTVNTLPPQTLEAFIDHGRAALTLTQGLETARALEDRLAGLGISLAQVTRELEEEGVQAFAGAFEALLQTIEQRRLEAVAGLGPLAPAVRSRVESMESSRFPERLWSGDASLWTDDPAGQEEIRQRLGWLGCPQDSTSRLSEWQSFARKIRRDGVESILLLGMGGSSLGPEVLGRVFNGLRPDVPRFAILDSTDPAQVAAAAAGFPPDRSLYLVASKSGGTAEVAALLDYFWDLSGQDGRRFVAITDPGSPLAELARQRSFGGIFLGDPEVGGRYSVLTAFGLLPAALLGLDLDRLLDRATWMMRQCTPELPAARNPGLVLGAILGQAALDGRDKLTILADEPYQSMGAWLEQLLAESSGKDERGILPVDGEPPGLPESYGADRLFVYLCGDGGLNGFVDGLQQAGHPVLRLPIDGPYSLGADFYRWEVAAAAACAVLGVNAFDQPDVQDSKARTQAKLLAYRQNGSLGPGQPVWERDGLQVYSPVPVTSRTLQGILAEFLLVGGAGGYLAVNAFLPYTAEAQAVLAELRRRLMERTGWATTIGFGPRYLHSTGQYHKGGPAGGRFLLFTVEPERDLEIPGQGMTFGLLEQAQALGDYEALSSRGRPVLHLHFPSLRALAEITTILSNP
jgi:transaldolase / glucose-6-phosphate isomerase